MRLIVDNNLLISAALVNGSFPDLAFEKGKQVARLLHSQVTIKELSVTLCLKGKFSKYVDLETCLEFEFKQVSQLVKISSQLNICRDLKDNMYLELALSGKADCIISGDKVLQVLDPFKGIRIISPKSFLDQF